MNKILGIIIVGIMIGGGYYFFKVQHHGNVSSLFKTSSEMVPFQNILNKDAFEKIKVGGTSLISGISGTSGITSDSLQTMMNSFTTTSQFPLAFPKGWQIIPITVGGKTFKVLTADTARPPRVYISTEFPREVMTKVTLLKCLNLDPQGSTDWCMVGNNDTMNTYFQMMKTFSQSSFSTSNLLEFINESTPRINL